MQKCVCGEEMTPAEWKNQWVCHRCGRTKPMRTTVTNADRIRAMSDEEIAEAASFRFCPSEMTDKSCVFRNCKECWIKWLQTPAKEVDK